MEVFFQEFMKIMGLTTTLYWTSWFLQVFFHLFIIVIIYVTILMQPIFEEYTVIESSSASLILFFFLVWGASCITLTFIFAALFSRATKAAIVVILIWLVPMALENQIIGKSTSVQLAACLWSTLGLCIGYDTIHKFEKVGEG
ncbi:unnamed protein product, partial [Callosobruchus maculatus]